MAKDGRGDEDGGPWWKADDQAEIPKYKVTSKVWVEISECCDSAPTPCKIGRVCMGKCDGPRAKVKGGSREHAFLEVAFEVRIPG